MSPRGGRSQFERLDKVVPKVLRELGIDGGARILQITERWEDALGPELARHCRPVRLRGDVLDVEVATSVWCQQLQLQSPQLLEALEAALGELAPKALRFRIG